MPRLFSRSLITGSVCALVLGVLSLSARARAQEAFTLAVIPDSQQEVLNAGDARLAGRLQWLVDHRQELNLVMVLHVGDLLNWDTPDHIQYQRASEAMTVLDNARIPYALAVGNHDTAATKEGGSAAPGNTNHNQRNTTTFNTYFPAKRLQVVGQTYEGNQVENAYHTFRAGGLDWLAINLELWARTGAVDWADKVIEAHPHHNVILLTHAFLTGTSAIQKDNGGYGDKSPQYVFDHLLRPHANVRMVFSGHVGGHGYRTDTGDHGNTIYEFLQCYHDRANPVRLVEIDPQKRTIKTRVYSPSTGKNKDDGSTMTIEKVEWVQPAPPAPAQP